MPKPSVTDDQVREAVERARGDLKAAAVALGVSPATVLRRIVAGGLFGRLCATLHALRAELDAAARHRCRTCGRPVDVVLRCEACGERVPPPNPYCAQSQAEAILAHVVRCPKHPMAFWINTARALVTAADARRSADAREALEAFRAALVDLTMLPETRVDSLGRRRRGPCHREPHRPARRKMG